MGNGESNNGENGENEENDDSPRPSQMMIQNESDRCLGSRILILGKLVCQK